MYYEQFDQNGLLTNAFQLWTGAPRKLTMGGGGENIQVAADKLFNTDWVLSYKLAQKSVMAKV